MANCCRCEDNGTMSKVQRQTVFAQGMRRSGTTIVFDLMLEDGRFDCFYEPLAPTKPAFGGGSAMRAKTDLFENVRAARKQYLDKNPNLLARCPKFTEHNFLNYGAPRLAALEFEPELPRYCRDYVAHLTQSAPYTFLKFTRMHSKAFCLKDIEPDAKFIHILRDPRHVVASYLFGKQSKFRSSFEDRRDFFTRVSSMSRWSSREFSDFILSYEDKDYGEPFEDFLRILLVWKYKFETTFRQASEAFGDNYFLLRHEDLLEQPESTIEHLYEFLGIEQNLRVLDWARSNLRSPSEPYAHRDEKWQIAFGKLDMWDALERSGYAQRLLDEGVIRES